MRIIISFSFDTGINYSKEETSSIHKHVRDTLLIETLKTQE